jgi:PAS domain S-box-containing protein
MMKSAKPSCEKKAKSDSSVHREGKSSGLKKPKNTPPWQPFLAAMSRNVGPRAEGKKTLESDLAVFLSLPVSRSASLFILDKKTFEFNHHLSTPGAEGSAIRATFAGLVERGLMADALNAPEGYLIDRGDHREGNGDWLILPLKGAGEIAGIILIALTGVPGSLDPTLQQLCLVQARHLAEDILNRTLASELRANESLLRQRISGRTQSLEQARRELKTILDSIKTGVIIIDRQTRRIINANKTALALTGYSKDRLLGSPCQMLCLAENKKCPFAEGGSSSKLDHFESVLTKANGEAIPVLKTVVPLVLGGHPCLLESFVDISEQKHLERQFYQSQKLEAIGRLAGGVAHDFNNLLMAIMGYCELTQKGLSRGSQPFRLVEEINRAAERAAGLTGQLLALSRQQVLQPKIIDLNAVLTDIKKMLLRIIGEDIELISRLDSSLGYVRADKGQIEQVVMNLTVNARDAMPRGGRLLFETTNVEIDQGYRNRHPVVIPGSYVLMTVSDNGEGMSREIQGHIFEPFFTTKGVGKGTGLGLSTVYGIVKQSGGYIWVYSEVGQGTTIKIYLPQALEPLIEAEATLEPKNPPRGSETILLIEDELMLRSSIKEGLEINGYRVLEAGSGDEALSVSQSHGDQIHLVLTDVVMPGMNGREVAESLSGAHPEAKVLYMSGYTDDAVIRHGLLNENTAFLQKPFTPRTLALKVREILDQPGNSREGVPGPEV